MVKINTLLWCLLGQRIPPLSTPSWWELSWTNELFFLIIQRTLSHQILLLHTPFVIEKQSSTIYYSIQITSLHCFIIYLVFLKSSLNIDFRLNWVNVTSFCIVSNMSVMIWQLVVIAWHNPSFNSSMIAFFNHMVYLSSSLLDYVLSIVIIFHGLNLILTHSVNFNVLIIVKVYRFLLSCPRSSSYSKITKWTSLLHLFSSDILVPSQLCLKLIGLLVARDIFLYNLTIHQNR